MPLLQTPDLVLLAEIFDANGNVTQDALTSCSNQIIIELRGRKILMTLYEIIQDIHGLMPN